MPRQLPQFLTIRAFDVTSNTILEYIDMEKVDTFEHSTRLPGGFWTMKFRMAMTEREYWEWRENRQFIRIVLEQAVKQTLWEGRLEVMSGEVTNPMLTFRGYWSNFTDAVNNATTYSRDYSSLGGGTHRADEIVDDMLNGTLQSSVSGFHADTIQVSTATTNIANTGVDLNLDFDTSDKAHLSLWRVLTDPNFGVLSFPDSSDNQVDFAVWEDREVYLTARNPSSVTWKAYLKGEDAGVERFPARTTIRNIAKSVTSLYESASTLTETSVAVDSDLDTASELRRELVTQNIGESDATTAQALRDGTLAAQKDLQQEVDDFTITKVFDANGIEQPICKIRAGDVLQIPDFVPTSVGISTVNLDALRTFVIEETTCDHLRGSVKIRPDRKSKSLSAILARANLS